MRGVGASEAGAVEGGRCRGTGRWYLQWAWRRGGQHAFAASAAGSAVGEDGRREEQLSTLSGERHRQGSRARWRRARQRSRGRGEGRLQAARWVGGRVVSGEVVQ